MLQVLRNSVASIFAKILFGLLVLSFAIWGMGDIFSGGFFGNTVAKVGDVKIGANEVGLEFQREINNLRRRGMDIDTERARQIGLLDRVVDTMVSRAGFDAEVMDLGLTASDAVVAEQIRTNPAFRGNLGSFDRIQFEQLLRANGLTEETYVADLRRDIARNQALDSISTTVQVPKTIADLIYGWREEKRIAGVTNIPVDTTAAVPEPTTTELQAFHEANAAEFTSPERRAIDYVHLSAIDFAKRISITEDELVAAFEDRAEEFAVAETRKVLQMVVSDETEANTAKTRLSAGEDFAAVAKEIAGQSAESIDLGDITRNDLPEELAPPVFALQQGDVSSPIKGPFGWHIFKIENISPRKEATLADVRDRLTQELSSEKAVDDVYRTANKLEDSIGAGTAMDAAASALGLEVRTLAAVDSEGRDAAGEAIANLPGAPFLETVFSTAIEDAGTLIETEDGGFFILRVKSIAPAKLQPLTDVRDRVVAAWQREKRIELAEARARTVAQALEGGRALSDIPEADGETLVPTNPFTRQGGAAQTILPFEIINQIFEFKSTGKVAVGRAGDRFVVARLMEIQAAEPSKDFDGYRGLAQNLRASLSNDLLHQYNRALRDSHGVSINDAVLDQLFSDDQSYPRR